MLPDDLHRPAVDPFGAADHLDAVLDRCAVGGGHLPHDPGVDAARLQQREGRVDGLRPGATATIPTPS